MKTLDTIKSDLTAEKVRSLFTYNRRTGELRWRASLAADFRYRQVAGQIAGYITKKGYRTIGIEGSWYQAHRLIWLYVRGRWPVGRLDHENRKRSDNRFGNLREATNAQNTANSAVTRNRTGLRGIYWNKQRRHWHAQIRVDGKMRHVGFFDTPEAAHGAYLKAKKKHFGEFAGAAPRGLTKRKG